MTKLGLLVQIRNIEAAEKLMLSLARLEKRLYFHTYSTCSVHHIDPY